MIEANIKEPRLVIVDDDRAISNLYAKVAKLQGFDVTTVTDGQMFLDHMSKHTVDAAILDLVMPQMDGFEVISALKDMAKHPVLIISSGQKISLLNGAERFAKDCGIDVFGLIQKPVDIVALQAKIKAMYMQITT